ncbi:hypothetical protein NW752_002437 [Fusarium irregulare]|uniref:Uncharacterized protein n=1 Tax=Fusarium irregulare TaxID=2494466 RepID=A0A9W8PGW4_9HYPO|nr:hypothetical protein NW766_011154 [Fusarium irregulare]KAJ4024981.1 hypothetical protein NW752_002437 [Fusarium irregulare]
MPHMLLFCGFNIVSLCSNAFKLHELKNALRNAGITIKKRVIAKGLMEGAITKFGSTAITLGQDDFATGSKAVTEWFNQAGAYIANHTNSVFSPLNSLSASIWDKENRMDHSLFQNSTAIANGWTNIAENVTGTDQTKSLGWDQEDEDLAKQVVVVGGATAAAMKVADHVLETPYDEGKDSRWYKRQRGKIRRWFK